MDVDAAGRQISGLLSAVCPDGFYVTYESGEVTLYRDLTLLGRPARDGARSRCTIPWFTGVHAAGIDDVRTTLEKGCVAVLDEFEDFVREFPVTSPLSGGTRPAAGAKARGDSIRLYYGDPDDPRLVVGELAIY